MAEPFDDMLTHEELQARLQALDLHIGLSTLKRWAYEGVIQRPQRYKRGKGGKKGRAVKWSPRAVEEACAVWAIRNGNITRKIPSIKTIEEIKRAVRRVYQSPIAVYRIPLPPKIHSLSLEENEENEPLEEVVAGLDIDDVSMELVDDEELHSLMTIWIAAAEKARKGWLVTEPAKVVFHWYRVHERFGTPPVYSVSDHTEVRWDHYESDDLGENKLECITLEIAERDEVKYLIDGEDSRRDALIGTSGRRELVVHQ